MWKSAHKLVDSGHISVSIGSSCYPETFEVDPENFPSYLDRQSVSPESIFAQLQAVDPNEPIRRRHDSNDNRDLHK